MGLTKTADERVYTITAQKCADQPVRVSKNQFYLCADQPVRVSKNQFYESPWHITDMSQPAGPKRRPKGVYEQIGLLERGKVTGLLFSPASF